MANQMFETDQEMADGTRLEELSSLEKEKLQDAW